MNKDAIHWSAHGKYLHPFPSSWPLLGGQSGLREGLHSTSSFLIMKVECISWAKIGMGEPYWDLQPYWVKEVMNFEWSPFSILHLFMDWELWQYSLGFQCPFNDTFRHQRDVYIIYRYSKLSSCSRIENLVTLCMLWSQFVWKYFSLMRKPVSSSIHIIKGNTRDRFSKHSNIYILSTVSVMTTLLNSSTYKCMSNPKVEVFRTEHFTHK